jgi:hypothetical protein
MRDGWGRTCFQYFLAMRQLGSWSNGKLPTWNMFKVVKVPMWRGSHGMFTSTRAASGEQWTSKTRETRRVAGLMG